MRKISNKIKVIAFDADDTLWVNETYFREAEQGFSKLLSKYETLNKIDQELFKKEISNLALYGYGVKAFILSMVESALEFQVVPLSLEVWTKRNPLLFTRLLIIQVSSTSSTILDSSPGIIGLSIKNQVSPWSLLPKTCSPLFKFTSV